MIPKTQSVCKHCGEPRTSYIHAPDLSDRAHVFEPVSEPASTGEPPPDSVKFVGTRQPTETEIEYGKTLDPMAKECLERNQAKMERAARPSEPSAPHTSAQPVKIKGFLCPKCQQPLKEIRYPSDCMLNRDQWESQLAGDLFCTCHNNGRGHEPNAYFWKYEFTEPAAPQPVSGDAPEPQLSVKCHTCDSLLVYKRKGEQIEIYHNCPGRIMEAVPAQGTPQPPKVEEIARIAVQFLLPPSLPREDYIELLVEKLRPYFPPASRISDLENHWEWCERTNVVICGGTPSATPEEMHGCGQQVSHQNIFRCVDCQVPFHRNCLRKHFNEHFPPASQTPECKCVGYLAGDSFATSTSLCPIHAEDMRAQAITEVHANPMTSASNYTPNGGRATPASTARTDGPNFATNETEQRQIDIINLRLYARLAEENEWKDDVIHWSVFQQTLEAIATRLERLPLPAAPGSVPQAPKDECLYGPVGKHIFNPHDDEPRRCVNCGVPQPELPKCSKCAAGITHEWQFCDSGSAQPGDAPQKGRK